MAASPSPVHTRYAGPKASGASDMMARVKASSTMGSATLQISGRKKRREATRRAGRSVRNRFLRSSLYRAMRRNRGVAP